MSVTRILCKNCGNPLVYCKCKKDDVIDSMKVICQKCGRQHEWEEIEAGKDGIVCKGGCEK